MSIFSLPAFIMELQRFFTYLLETSLSPSFNIAKVEMGQKSQWSYNIAYKIIVIQNLICCYDKVYGKFGGE